MRHLLTRWMVLGLMAILIGIFSTVVTKHTTLAKTKAFTAERVSTATLSNRPVKAVTENLVVANRDSSLGLRSENILLSFVSTSSEPTLLILSGISFLTIALFLRSRSHLASTANRP